MASDERPLPQHLPGPFCECFRPAWDSMAVWQELSFHNTPVDPAAEAYRQLADLILLTAERGLTEFIPRRELGHTLMRQISHLPPTIGLMDRCERFDLYGSHLEAIPRDIVDMKALRIFSVYTSYRLHWFPYELLRCPQLASSLISRRALYGNRRYRAPFPRLPSAAVAAAFCSVCDAALEGKAPYQRWISLGLGADIVPFLVSACSRHCMEALPPPAPGTTMRPHRGGLGSRPPVQP